ncbi:hypothetical protein GGR58DRAFT_519291 [Xylaria digitata]|nr:hypothetical protein GGR58DRAFT_519291 [Xylaria digitata]
MGNQRSETPTPEHGEPSADRNSPFQRPISPFKATLTKKVLKPKERSPSPSVVGQDTSTKVQKSIDINQGSASSSAKGGQNEPREGSQMFEVTAHSYNGLPQVDIIIVPDVTEKGLPSIPEQHGVEGSAQRLKSRADQPQPVSNISPIVDTVLNNTATKTVENSAKSKNPMSAAGQTGDSPPNEDRSRDQAAYEASLRRNPSYNLGSTIQDKFGVYWLNKHKHVLRAYTPQPRVLQFQYDTPQAQPNGNLLPEEQLEKLAQDLLSDLAHHCKPDQYPQPPIMFIGHGFGCMIIKRALMKSQENGEPNMDREKEQNIMRVSKKKSEVTEEQAENINEESRTKKTMELSSSTAGIIFLDAPIQISGQDMKPLTGHTGKRWVTDLLETKPDDTKESWKQFCRVVTDAAIPAVWLLGRELRESITAARVKEEWPILFSILKPNRDKTAGENERVFFKIVEEIRKCLVFKTSATDRFQAQLKEFVDNKKLKVAVKDHLGRNPLHWAVARGNIDAVAFLAGRSKDLICTGDLQGATPLHVAVQRAAKSADAAGIREHWANLFRELPKYQFEVHIEDVRDKNGKPAWYYASEPDQAWILKIRDEQRLKYGVTHSSMLKDPKPMDSPTGAHKAACQNYKPILLEIFNGGQDDRGHKRIRNVFNEGSASMYSMIYELDGWEKVLRRSRPPSLEVKCRWVHIPANNKLLDSNLKAIPGRPDEIWKSSNALVIYLPILAFETDNHRKDYDLARVILDKISMNGDRDVIKSTDDLIRLILTTSLDIFQREGVGGLNMRECFQSSIDEIADEHIVLFRNFKRAIQNLDSQPLSTDEQALAIDTFFSLAKETELLEDILDIKDELNIIRTILSQQLEFWPIWSRLPASSSIVTSLDVLRNNISVVDGMPTHAASVIDKLNHLLDLKQKQANAWEARPAGEGPEGAKKQGKVQKLPLRIVDKWISFELSGILLVFTCVAIVFLPLSFIFSYLALGFDKFPKDKASGGNPWSLGRTTAYLFGLSVVFVIPILSIAFCINGRSKLFRGIPLLGRKTAWLNLFRRVDHQAPPRANVYHTIKRGEVLDTATPLDNTAPDVLQTRPSRDHQYAPLFGRYKFHTKIWGLRNLWEYKSYGANDHEYGHFWNDEIDIDYPLHHHATKARGWFKDQISGWRRSRPREPTIPSLSDEQLPYSRTWSPIDPIYQESFELSNLTRVETEDKMARVDELSRTAFQFT